MPEDDDGWRAQKQRLRARINQLTAELRQTRAERDAALELVEEVTRQHNATLTTIAHARKGGDDVGE